MLQQAPDVTGTVGRAATKVQVLWVLGLLGLAVIMPSSHLMEDRSLTQISLHKRAIFGPSTRNRGSCVAQSMRVAETEGLTYVTTPMNRTGAAPLMGSDMVGNTQSGFDLQWAQGLPHRLSLPTERES